MQGVFIDGYRPVSKKAIKAQAATDASRIIIEATSLFGNEYGGPATDAPEGKTVYFVGPDPYTSRKFYGQLVRCGDSVKVT